MFRLWAKTFKDNRMLQDTVIEDASAETRTHKIFNALDQVCYQFDLGKPIWLDATVNDFRRHSKARFYQDNFVESIEFDYLEIQVIEEHFFIFLFEIYSSYPFGFWLCHLQESSHISLMPYCASQPNSAFALDGSA